MTVDGLGRATVNLDFLTRARLILRNPDLRPAFKEIRKPLRADQREHAKAQQGPDGTWAPRASSTKMRASGSPRRRRTGPRRMLGRLPTALSASFDRRALVLRSMIPWSDAHNSGPSRVGHGAKVPRRTFLWASDKVTELAAGVIARVVGRLFERA